MAAIRNFVSSVERFLQGESGQRFFNISYSLGAAIVIWGALFKILHLPGGNTLLCVGMGTEVLMFILTAFDRPSRPGTSAAESDTERQDSYQAPASNPVVMSDRVHSLTFAQDEHTESAGDIGESLAKLAKASQALEKASQAIISSYSIIAEKGDEIKRDSEGYVSQMEALTRNLAGLNAVYDIQLRSISSQLENIESVNRGMKDIRDMYEKAARESSDYCIEAEKMAANMRRLNRVYENMLTAMTVNMVANPFPQPSADQSRAAAED